LAYYRSAAHNFSDDGVRLCGAFGARLGGLGSSEGQLPTIIERLEVDRASRRTFASIIAPSDNLVETLEYPCAAGVQLFLRDGQLHWLTVMRSQHALTIFPYDLFLFSSLHHFAASRLNVGIGVYRHFSGSFHIYESERTLAGQVADSEIGELRLAAIPWGKANHVADELIWLEKGIRSAAESGEGHTLEDFSSVRLEWDFNRQLRDVFVAFARTKM
jgi:hypothetical protein